MHPNMAGPMIRYALSSAAHNLHIEDHRVDLGYCWLLFSDTFIISIDFVHLLPRKFSTKKCQQNDT